MTKIIIKGSKIFKIVEENGKKHLAIDSKKFIKRLRKSWLEASNLTNNKAQIGYAFYEAMFKLFSDITVTQEIPIDNDDQALLRSMEKQYLLILKYLEIKNEP